MTTIARILAGEAGELRVSGRLDAHGSSSLEAEMNEAVRAGARKIGLALDEVSFLGSAGIRVLLKGHQLVARLGGTLRVTGASETVREVLRLGGLDDFLGTGAEAEAPRAAGATSVAGIPGRLHALVTDGPMEGRLAGEPGRLATGAFDATTIAELSFPPGTLGLGLGAFGRDFDDCRDRFGEFLAAGGAAACLPSNGARTPDDVVTRGALVPSVQALYGISCRGSFSRLFRFEASAGAAALPLSRLVAAALELAAAPTAAFVLVAESAGLLGAALRRSPVAAGDLFAFPEVRESLSFSAERVHERATALVVGVAAASEETPLAPFVRPAGASSLPAVHAHAAAFTFRALPSGEPELETVVRGLFEEERLLGLLHLLPDSREITGVGESLFLAGTLWAAPLSLAPRTGGAA